MHDLCQVLDMLWRTVLPPGCVAPKDWSTCSMVGCTCGELKWTPLKDEDNNEQSKVFQQLQFYETEINS